jgi:hypothetical protein
MHYFGEELIGDSLFICRMLTRLAKVPSWKVTTITSNIEATLDYPGAD